MKNTLLLFCYLSALVTYSQPTQQWLNRYNGQGDLSDKLNSVKTDASNSVYLGGYTFNAGNAEDLLTIKLNPLGDTAWVRTYNGTANNTDEVLDVTNDATGNVYVTGVIKNITTGKDFITIKYNSAGDTLWVREYNGTGNGDDDASVIFVDGNGNVYVTGKSDGDASALVNNDYATVKYNSAGVQLWVARYNGSGNASDIPAGVVADGSGDVFVSGRSNNGIDDDFATIKYDAAGVQQWAMVYDGGFGTDRASSITIDGSSNVYVTGRSANAIDDNYATIKYNTLGTLQWISSYDGGAGNDRATALTVDGTGNVFVTGKSSNGINDDFATVQYNLAGTQLWASVWSGAGNGNDAANAIAVDGSGNVYVTGVTDADPTVAINNNYSTVKYNSTGVQVWNQLFNGTANLTDAANDIALDAAGNVIVAGNSQGSGTQRDGVSIKYDAAGATLWNYRFNGHGDNNDKGNAITIDAAGNSYVTGSTYRNGTGKDYCTLKYNSAGDTIWVKTYNGTGNGGDEASAIEVDGAGNVYVTGYSKGAVSQKDYTTIKYNSLGDTLWVKRYNGTGNGDDFAVALKVDAAGNVYVTGYTDADISAAGINENYTTIKYGPTGTQLWVSNYNGSGNVTDIPAALSVDGTGNVYVTGKSSNGSDDDYATIKYNSSGAQQWLQVYDGGQGDDRGAAITLDAAANVYVTGRIANGSDDDFGTIKYNTAGTQQWIKLYDGLLGNDRATAIAVDFVGNVYVTGKGSNGTTDDFKTVKYNSAGAQQWAKSLNGVANGNDTPSKIIVDGAGNIVVAGQSDNGTASVINNDYTIVKYDSWGTQLWKISYDGTASGADGINAVTIDNTDNIYVTGTSSSITGQNDIVTIKYNSPVGIHEMDNNLSAMIVYPNPFCLNTTISLLGENTPLSWTLNIFNAMGEKVVSQKVENSNQTNINRNALSDGVYFYLATDKTKVIGNGSFIIGE